MSPSELAQARHNAYQLFSQLFLKGISEPLLPYIAAVPELREQLPQPLSLDEAAADHHRLFSMNLFPYESVFLDPEGILEGPITRQLIEDYGEMGFGQVTNDVSADHIGHELAAVAFLCGAEADAWQDGVTARAHQIRTRQLGFLRGHLLRWWTPFAAAVQGESEPFFGRLVALTTDLLFSHVEELQETVIQPVEPFSLPESPDLLGSDKTGLKEIAQFLVKPPYAGLFLSRTMIGELGRRHQLPRGFGSRELVLHNLLKAAVQYEALPAVLAELKTMFVSAQSTFAAQDDAGGSQVWQARAGHTATLLTQMQDRIDQIQADDE